MNSSPSRTKPFTFSWMTESPARLVACGLGSGLLKPAPGTWGTLFAWFTWQLVPVSWEQAWIAFVLFCCFFLGVWACDQVGKEVGQHDHGAFVWDEIVAFWIVLWLIPEAWWWQTFGFILFRCFDILKPYPIRFFDEKLTNGFGVMVDDILAAAYTLLFVALVIRFF